MQMSPGAKLLDSYPSTYLPHSVSQWCFQIRCRIFSAFCFEMAGQFIKVFHSSTGADIKMTLLQLLQRRWWCCCCHDDNWEERTGLGCLDRGGRCLFQLSLGLPNGHTPPIPPPISELFGAIRSYSDLYFPALPFFNGSYAPHPTILSRSFLELPGATRSYSKLLEATQSYSDIPLSTSEDCRSAWNKL